jgi:molecular chaperone GrpE
MDAMKKHSRHEPDPPEEPTGDAAAAAAQGSDRAAEAASEDVAKRERDEAIAQLKRAQADFQNLRRRTQGEIDQAVRRSQQRLLEELLLAIDHLELALGSPTSTEEARKLAQGVKLTRDAMLRALEGEGVRAMASDKRFDPARHFAVASVPTPGRAPGEVLETVRQGYTWNDVVLRPAQVVVTAEPQSAADRARREEGRELELREEAEAEDA